MTALPPGFLARPFAHRGLHDSDRPENSIAAALAAIERNFAVEVDVQLTADYQAVVFHDDDLGRLTERTGPVRNYETAELAGIRLCGTVHTIPSLPGLLHRIGGHAPLVIEIKDQDGSLGPDVGPLEHAVARALASYRGPVAVMSFNPHSMAHMKQIAPDIPRGLVTCAFTEEEWPDVPEKRRENLRSLSMLDGVGASFVSHDVSDLESAQLAGVRARGLPILCWTVRSTEIASRALRRADQITFESFSPASAA